MESASKTVKRAETPGADHRPASAALPTILTTHHKRSHPAWTRRTILLPGWYEAFPRANVSYLRSAVWAWRLFRESRKYDAVVTGAEHVGSIFALLQTLFRSQHTRRTHVVIDFPWAASPGRLKLMVKRMQMRMTSRSMDAIFAHASPEEAERFTSVLGTRPGLFRYVPYHCWVTEPRPQVSEGSYVFSGGDFRDYATLLRAVDGAPYHVVICVRDTAYFKGLKVLRNVEIATVPPERFDELLANCGAVVVPLPGKDIHTGGHTVILAAMALGKPIIVAGTSEYRHYLQHQVNGLLTPPSDSAALRACIDRVLMDASFAAMLGQNALKTAPQFSPETFFARVFDAVDAAEAERGRTTSGD